MKIGHIEQHAQLSVLPHEAFELRHEPLVVRDDQFPGDVNCEHFPAVFFLNLNRHNGRFDGVELTARAAREVKVEVDASRDCFTAGGDREEPPGKGAAHFDHIWSVNP